MSVKPQMDPVALVGVMRDEWDARARQDARYFICTDLPRDEQAFLASGRDDYRHHVGSFMQASRFDAAGKTALEIGCGIGRMTRCFAEEFAEVIGLDISAEMIARARAADIPRARFVVGGGSDLAGIASAAVDFVFSYIVFQHIPEQAVILRYFEEIGRVLRPGGLFRIHMNGLPQVRVGRLLLEGYISDSPKLRVLGLRKLPFVRRRRLGTWLGHPISAPAIRRACRRGGLTVTRVTGRWTVNQWIEGRKD